MLSKSLQRHKAFTSYHGKRRLREQLHDTNRLVDAILFLYAVMRGLDDSESFSFGKKDTLWLMPPTQVWQLIQWIESGPESCPSRHSCSIDLIAEHVLEVV